MNDENERLALIPVSVLDESQLFFSCPSIIDKWRSFFCQSRTLPLLDESICQERAVYLDKWRRGLIHRLQYLETLAGLLLGDCEFQKTLLHETNKYLFIHTFYVFTDSFLEGLGSYLYRCNEYALRQNIRPVDKRIKESIWFDALAKYLNGDGDKQAKISIQREIEFINDVRDLIHMDRKTELDFMKLSYGEFYFALMFLSNVLKKINKEMDLDNVLIHPPKLFETCELTEGRVLISNKVS